MDKPTLRPTFLNGPFTADLDHPTDMRAIPIRDHWGRIVGWATDGYGVVAGGRRNPPYDIYMEKKIRRHAVVMAAGPQLLDLLRETVHRLSPHIKDGEHRALLDKAHAMVRHLDNFDVPYGP